MFKTDQAAGLRRLFSRKQSRSIVIGGSGKAKANVIVNLAQALVDKGDRVMIIDGSHGEIGQLYGVKFRYELSHVLDGDKSLYETLHKGPDGIHLLPAARGLTQLSGLDFYRAMRLQHAFAQWVEPIDTVLINAREKTTSNILTALQGRAHVLIMALDSTDSITSAYGEIKSLNQQHDMDEFNMIIGMQKNVNVSTSIFMNLSNAARRYLSARLHLKGIVPLGMTVNRDSIDMYAQSLFYETPISSTQPFRELAHDIDKWLPPSSIRGSGRKEITHASVS